MEAARDLTGYALTVQLKDFVPVSRVQPLTSEREPKPPCGPKIHRPFKMVILPFQAPVGAPVHPFWLLRKSIIHAAYPAQKFLDSLKATQSAFKVSFTLAVICQFATVTASKDRPPVQDCNAPAAPPCGAMQPGALATIVASAVRYSDRVFFTLPLFPVPAPMLVGEDHGLVRGASLNPACVYSIPRPRERERLTRHQMTLFLQKTDIDLLVVACSVFSTSVPAHAPPLSFYPKSSVKSGKTTYICSKINVSA